MMPFVAISIFTAVTFLVFCFSIVVTLPGFLVWYEKEWKQRLEQLNPLRQCSCPSLKKPIDKFFTEIVNDLVFRWRSWVVILWFILVPLFTIITIFQIETNSENSLQYEIRGNTQINKDLEIMKNKMPPGGSTALWSKVVFGIEGYDPNFWGGE